MDQHQKNAAIAVQTSIISIVVNFFLFLFKLICGIVAASSAMISDAVHSASDVFSTVVVIIGIKIASKEPDTEHPYGHERFESIAALLLAAVLFITGGIIGWNGIDSLRTGNWTEHKVPGTMALIAAIVSIVVKEVMYQYTMIEAKKTRSDALKADAWHHRSDALSSIGALAAIWFSRRGLLFMDSVASIIISIFVIKAAFDIAKESINKVVDKSCPCEFCSELSAKILEVPGVLALDSLMTREFGNRSYVDVEIAADENLSLHNAHEIAEAVHDMIEHDFPTVKHASVHVNPYRKPE